MPTPATRRQVLSRWGRAVGAMPLAAALVAVTLPGQARAADAYPTRPLKIVVPFSPGAITDATSRILATELTKVIGQSVLVENRPGGGTVIGTQAVKNAPADGYTILFQLSSLATNVYLLKQPGYALADFSAVAMLGQAGYVLVAGQKNSKFPTIQELIAFGKANPGALNASGTADGAATVIGSKLKRATGVDWALINYKGGAEAVQAVMSGDVHFSLPTQAAPLIYANPDRLRILAVTSKKRLDFLPDVPTFTELGYPIDEQTWFGLFVRSDTPPDVLARIRSSLAEVLNSATMKEQLRKLRISPYEGTLEGVPARLKQELEDFTQEARKLGIEPQ
ncbi:MAG: tripartite tricarboxylate transporter substrate binding protein [Xanthobacteraceae bacterium]